MHALNMFNERESLFQLSLTDDKVASNDKTGQLSSPWNLHLWFLKISLGFLFFLLYIYKNLNQSEKFKSIFCQRRRPTFLFLIYRTISIVWNKIVGHFYYDYISFMLLKIIHFSLCFCVPIINLPSSAAYLPSFSFSNAWVSWLSSVTSFFLGVRAPF